MPRRRSKETAGNFLTRWLGRRTPLQRYLLARLSLLPVTLLLIFTINWVVIMLMPGGFVDQLLARGAFGNDLGSLAERSVQIGAEADAGIETQDPATAGERPTTSAGDPTLSLEARRVDDLRELLGLDKPLYVTYFQTLWAYLRFDFGDSLTYNQPVVKLVWDRMPLLLGLGVASYIIGTLISFTFGILKAYRQNTRFDAWTTTTFISLDAIPQIVMAVTLLSLFAAGGAFFQPDGLIPHRGLVSDNFAELSWWGKIKDYLWHMIVPVSLLLVGSYAAGVNLLRNAYADQLNQTYVMTARSKGLTENQVFWRHVFRNGGILIIPGIPAAIVGLFFTGSVFIERIFDINGLGTLGLDAISDRDFKVFLGTLWIFSLMGLGFKILSDLMLVWVDPRINFAAINRAR